MNLYDLLALRDLELILWFLNVFRSARACLVSFLRLPGICNGKFKALCRVTMEKRKVNWFIFSVAWATVSAMSRVAASLVSATNAAVYYYENELSRQ